MRRTAAALFLATAAMAAAVLVLAAALPGRPASAARPADPTATPPSATTARGCRVESDRAAAPAHLTLSDTVAVTLTLRGCLPPVAPLHVVLVLDLDRGDEAYGDVREAMFDLVDEIELGIRPHVRVGVVTFDPRVKVVAPLAVSAARARGALARVERAGPRALADGIDRARELLVRGRSLEPSDAAAIREVIVVVAPGCGDEPTAAGRVVTAANQAKSQRILVVAAGSIDDDGRALACFRAAASSPRYFYERRDLGRIVQLFRSIVDARPGGPTVAGAGVVITETLGGSFALVGGSDHPPAVVSADGRGLTWRLPVTLTDATAGVVTASYRARPLAAGRWPLSAAAGAAFTDGYGARGYIPFPPATLDVVDAAASDARVCPGTAARAPADAIAAALARPDTVAGWGQRCSAQLPPGPTNPLRQNLSLARPGRPYHPIANGLVWACGCR